MNYTVLKSRTYNGLVTNKICESSEYSQDVATIVGEDIFSACKALMDKYNTSHQQYKLNISLDHQGITETVKILSTPKM